MYSENNQTGNNSNTDLWGDWPHQSEAIAAIEKAWSEGIRSVCFQCPTGGGKTRVLRRIIENHHASKKVIYVIAHRRNLVQQLSNEIDEADVNHGIIAAGYPYVRYRVQVASLQTIIRRKDNIPEPEIIIIDEIHHVKCNSYLELLKSWPNARILGTSATPSRTDGKPLSDVIQKIILGPPMRELIDNGFLSDFDYYAPETIAANGMHKRAGEYAMDEAALIMDKKVITGNAVEHYRKYSDHLPAIASCANIAHAEHVAAAFAEAGYKARAIHSGMDDRDIARCIAGLKDGSVEILAQCELLGEGIDIPGATTLIGLRHTASIVIYLQHIGRILRKHNGKKRAIVLDHVGNWTRFGLPDDPRTWTLDGSAEKETDVLPYKRCPECFWPVRSSASVCPHCGYVWKQEVQAKLPEEVEGELRQIKGWQAQGNLKDAILSKGCNTLKEAIAVAREMGQTHRQAWAVWVQVLGRSY
jgi:superfamily II DNA or RNA helicase